MRTLLLVILLTPMMLFAVSQRDNLLAIADAAAAQLAESLPAHAVIRIDSLGAGNSAADFSWRLGAAFTEQGVQLSDAVQLDRNHRTMVSLQEDPAFEGQAEPGRFTPPTHRVWGAVTQSSYRRLGMKYVDTDIKLGLEELSTGVTLRRFSMESTVRDHPPVWTLLALFAASLLMVVGVNVMSRGHFGAAALAVALVIDLLYLAWFIFA